MTKLQKKLASAKLSLQEWKRLVYVINDLYRNKCVIDMNEREEGKFDILEILHYKASSKHTIRKENVWELIICRNDKLSIIFCSILFFDSLKVLGKAKHKIVKC